MDWRTTSAVIKSSPLLVELEEYQCRRNGFGIGGGGALSYKKDTILYMSISVISKVN